MRVRRLPSAVAAIAAVALTAATPVELPRQLDVVAPDGVPDRGPVLSEPIDRGSLVLAAPTTRTPAARTVDGDPADWIGEASGISGTTVWDAGEHIHSDFLFDAHGADDGRDAERLADFAELFYAETRTSRIDQILRTSGSQLGVPEPLGADDQYGDQRGGLDEADLREVRWGADATGERLQLLVRLANATDASRLGVLVLADRDGGGGDVGFGTGLTATRFDRAVMIRADGAEARDLADGEPVPVVIETAADLSGWTNAVEASLPAELLTGADGTFDVSVVTGRFDDAGAFVPLNIAYRHAEPLEIFNDRLQALDLHAGDIDRFSSGPIAVADLVAGRTETMERLGAGYHERHLRSGENISREQGQHGIWQPYGVYVPTGYEAGTPTPTTFWLHYRGGKAHSGVVINPRLVTQLGEEPTNLMVFPHGRGTSEWYVTESHQDFFEVFDDAHALLGDIDPTRRYVSGYSMGGYGSWLLGSLYPDLFAAAYVQSGAITQGAWVGGGPDEGDPDPTFDQGWIEANDGDARAQLTYRALENLRHVPFTIDHGTFDELVPVTGIERMAARLTELGYAHRFTRFIGYEHFTQAIVDEWADGASFLQQFTAPTDPRQVTYAVVPALVWSVNSIDPPAGATFDFAPDGAYWVDDVVVREVPVTDEASGRPEPSVKGVVDLTAEALEATATLTVPDAGAVSPPGHSTPYVRTGLQQLDDPTGLLAEETANRFSGTLTNVASVSLDATRMGLDLSHATGSGFGFDLTVDGPTTIRLVDAAFGGRSLFDPASSELGEGLSIRRDGRDVVIEFTQPGTYSYTAAAASS